MFKAFAVLLVAAVCIAPAYCGTASADAKTNDAAATATVNQIQTLDPRLIDQYGYQIGVPLLAPNLGALSSLYAAALPPRSFVGKSKPVVVRGPYSDLFIGESSLGIVAL